MKKLIASNFELDLSNYEITTTEENPWFADSFSSKITYPFEIDLTNEIDIALGFISRNTTVDTLYECKYFEDDQIHDATFEILEEQDGKLQVSYEYGLEEFPLWDKKLSELPLESFDLTTQDIYDYAATHINKSWPEVNFNFPAVHTTQYADDGEIWGFFEGVINNYQNSEFLRNTYDTTEIMSYNRNIMQPFPALMHVMETIASASGYTLKGDILTDINLADNFIFSPKEYFIKRDPVEYYVARLASNPSTSSDIATKPGFKQSTFLLELTVEKTGQYNISGMFRTRKYNNEGSLDPYKVVRIELGSTQIFGAVHTIDSLATRKFDLDINVDILNSTSKTLKFYAESNYYLNPGEGYADYNTIDFNVVMLAEYDAVTQTPIPTIRAENKIDLSKTVPEMTVGELITTLKNWHNYDYTIQGEEMIFNKIQDHMDFDDLISLEEFEVKSKLRKFQQGKSFLLHFAETEESKFTYDKVYQDVKGVFTENYTANKNTSDIEINGLPLPLDNIRNFETASAFENSDSKLYIVRYVGLVQGRNATLSPEPLLIPNIHETNFRKWFEFRINAVSFKISFTVFRNQVKNLNAKSKVFMYNKLHYIKTVLKTQITADVIEVEIESESLK